MTSFNANNATPTTVSELVTTTKDHKSQEPLVASIDSGPVQAYAKLEGDDFCYYIRTLQVSLGRKVTNPDTVDIPLGNTKSVSRQHARLFYNFALHRFELTVFGKNGAFVNEQFIERGVTVPLDNKTKIQIGEMAFVFLLPKADTDVVNTNNKSSPHNNDDNFGYISTPHQLEKNMTTKATPPTTAPKLAKQSIAEEDCDLSEGDNESGQEESIPFNGGKEMKPPYSYASLIAQAINSSVDKRMTLNGIYNYITVNYPYYQMAQNGWQNSIRHNLSLNKAFIKVPRGETEPGKGAFWTIDVDAETQFTNGVYKRTKRSGAAPFSEGAKKKFKKDTSAKESSDHLKEDNEAVLAEEGVEKANVTDDAVIRKNQNTATVTLADKDTALTQNEVLQKDETNNKEIVKESIVSAPPPTSNNTQEVQAHLQSQLQNTIRQHLLDPVRYPLPPSIAQLLPQAIAQLPPQLATQLTSTLQTVLKAKSDALAVVAPTLNEPSSTVEVRDNATLPNNTEKQ